MIDTVVDGFIGWEFDVINSLDLLNFYTFDSCAVLLMFFLQGEPVIVWL